MYEDTVLRWHFMYEAHVLCSSVNRLLNVSLDDIPVTGQFLPWIISQVFSLQKHVNFMKGWSVCLLVVPALHHQVEYLSWTGCRSFQIRLVTIVLKLVPRIFDHFFVGESSKWKFSAKRQNFPQSDSKCPDVTFAAEFHLKQMTDMLWVLHSQSATHHEMCECCNTKQWFSWLKLQIVPDRLDMLCCPSIINSAAIPYYRGAQPLWGHSV